MIHVKIKSQQQASLDILLFFNESPALMIYVLYIILVGQKLQLSFCFASRTRVFKVCFCCFVCFRSV